MMLKIFTQPNCPNCPASKELGKKLQQEGINVKYYDVKTPEGLAESLMHNILSTPSLIILNDGKVVQEFLGTTPKIEQVKEWL